MNAFILPFFCSVVLLCNAVSGLKCYSCISTTMEGCNATIIEAPSGECKPVPGERIGTIIPTCIRISGKIKLGKGESSTAVVRECEGNIQPIHFGCQFQTEYGWEGEVEYCVCDNSDYCNGHGSTNSGTRSKFAYSSVSAMFLVFVVYSQI